MRLPALLALAVLLQACNSKESLVTVEPSKSDIAGRYQLSRWSFSDALNSEISAKAASSYIDLREDGSLTFHEVPVVPDSGGLTFSIQRFHSGAGTYSIAPLGSTSKSEFYGLYIDCGNLPDPVDTPRLRGRGDSLTLSFEYFDGDFVQRMAFTRQAKLKTEH
jgi:hypothetical protein